MLPLSSSFFSIPYSLGERILRTSVFQIGVEKGIFERTLMWIYGVFSQKTFFPKGFDNQRAEQGLHSFIQLGAKIEFITPKDDMAKIHMMHLRSSDLEQRVLSFGAKWEKMTILENGKQKEIFAIIPPVSLDKDWKSFEKHLLKLKWDKRFVTLSNHETKEVMITCENAESIQDKDWHQRLFLHVNSASVSFIMLTRRAGFYLGCKQNICFFDPRGTWKSSGIPSEAGYYNDIVAVYEKVEQHYNPKDIWITSACGGSAPSAYLKSMKHLSGLNFIFENGFSDLKKDFVEPEGFIVKTFANYFWDGLCSRDIKAEDKPSETGFNIPKLWKDLKQTDLGKVMIVSVKNDQRLSPSVAKRNIELAQRINTKVHSLYFESQWKEDPHFDRYFKYPQSRKEALSFIFK